MSKSTFKINYLILALIIIAGAGIYWYSTYNKTNNSKETSKKKATTNSVVNKTPTAPVTTPEPQKNAGSLIIITQNSSDRELSKLSLTDQSVSKIYSDSQSSEKIVKSIGIDKTQAILLEAKPNNDHGNIASINLSNGEKTILQNNIPLGDIYIAKPSSNILLSTTFSQVERDFGYTLFISTLKGENKKQIEKNVPSVEALAFSNDSDDIIYNEITDTTKKLTEIKSNGSVIKSVPSNEEYFDLLYLNSGIYASLLDLAKNSKVIYYDSNLNKKDTDLPDKNGAEIDLTQTSTGFAYRRVVYSKQALNSQTSANIILFDSNKKTEDSTVQGLQIAGFINE